MPPPLAMPVSAQAAFAVCAGLLFLVGVLDAVGVIPLVLRMLSVDAEAGAEEQASRRERPGSRAAALRASRSVGSNDSVRGRGVCGSQSYAFGRGSSRARAAQLQRSSFKGSHWKGTPSDDERVGGSRYGLKPPRSKLREVVQAPGADRPLAFVGSGSYSSGASTSGYSYTDSVTSSDGRYVYSTDGEQFGDGSSVTAYEKDDLLGSDYSTGSELEGSSGGRRGGVGGGRGGGGGGPRRSGSTLSNAQRAYAHTDDGDGRWASGSDVEVESGRPVKGGSSRRATFSTPAVERILTPRSMLPALARAEKAVMVVTWERLLGAFLCVCSLLSLVGSYVAMNGLPELLSPGRRLTGGAAAAAAPTVLQEEQS